MEDNFKFRDVIYKIAASRFFILSLLMHILFVMLFGGKILFEKYIEPPDFAAEGEKFLTEPVVDNLPPKPEVPSAPQLFPSAPMQPAMSAITTINPAMQTFTVPSTLGAPPTMSNTFADKLAASSALSIKSHKSIGLPGTMGARGSDRRAAAMLQAGGKPPSEQAVVNALRWLQKVQNPDGTWGKQYPGAMTGLSLLCYLGHGETPATSREFADTVNNAINALFDAGKKEQGVLVLRGNGIDGNGAYEHAIATYALCEAYTMTKDERLAPVVKQAVEYILKGQGADGGWTYAYSKKIPSDTSVSGWQIQALKAAKLTGLPIDGIPAALDNSMKNLDRVFNPKNGSFGYNNPGDRTYSLTGVGVLCKVFWQGRDDPKVRAGIKDIMAGPPVDYTGPKANLYAWYYNTQACFMAGGVAWEKWNRMFQDDIVKHQLPDGSWQPTKSNETGGLGPADNLEGQLYRTCLCTLMLEVYYRYLPTGKEL